MNISEHLVHAEQIKPSPQDFTEFLPWLCAQLQMPFDVLFLKTYKVEHLSTMSLKSKAKQTPEIADSDKVDGTTMSLSNPENQEKVLLLRITYGAESIIQLKVENNKVTQEMLKILLVALPFQTSLYELTMKGKFAGFVLYELTKILQATNLTDVILDGTYLTAGNFDLLLEKSTNLRNLSLSRCSINDFILKNICASLHHLQPAANTLAFLNLSCNYITDDGAKHLADVLRTNRALLYLNLTSNLITDIGAADLLSILIEFPLTYEEIIQKKTRYLVYLRQKQVVFEQMLKSLKSEEDKMAIKRKTTTLTKTSPVKRKDTVDDNKKNLDNNIEEKAEQAALKSVGEFIDPFTDDNIIVKNQYTYCLGNNVLCYLNLSYNNLMYPTLNKIIEVFRYQVDLDRRPRGLINIIIEGNNLPEHCAELNIIDDYIVSGIFPGKANSGKKKTKK